SAWIPANERETEKARSVPPGLPGVSVCEPAAKPYESGLRGTTFALMVPFAIGTLFWISTTRYARPKTECSLFEKLTFPEIVGTSWNFCITAASLEPLSEPWARLIARTTPSIADGPVMKPPVAALICAASLFTGLLGSWPKAFAYVTNQ